MIKTSKGPQKTNLNSMPIIEIAMPIGIRTASIGRASKLTAKPAIMNNATDIKNIKCII